MNELEKQLNELKDKLGSALIDLQKIRNNTSGLGRVESELKTTIFFLEDKINKLKINR